MSRIEERWHRGKQQGVEEIKEDDEKLEDSGKRSEVSTCGEKLETPNDEGSVYIDIK